ncbi:MAG: hypothetical protein CMJ46_14080, partial [Planctomyces sp.]|nr:hypothetical protein [Planctomyces sp.]
MSISFSCPDCGKSYQVRDDLAGRRFKCKDCERPLKVPSAVKSEEFFDEEPARRPARRKQSTGRKSSADRKRSSSRSGRKNGPQSPIQTLLSDKKLVIITACVLGLFAVPMCSCCGFFVWVETKVKQQAEQQMAVRMAPVQRNNSTISYDEQKARLKTNLTTRGPAPQEYE